MKKLLSRRIAAGSVLSVSGLLVSALLILIFPLVGCSPATDGDGATTSHFIELGPDAQKNALSALIQAKTGDVVEFGPGRFEFDSTLSLDVPGVTIKGAGIDATILDFANQAPGTGGEGLMVTADDFTIEDLSVYNTRADAIKVEGTTNATFRRVFINWEGDPRTENGAYGLYPVQVTNVLIEDSKVRGCSDAGIYVGQSQNIIVRRNEAWENVAGIEIENSTGADVHDNKTWNNTGGILVFSLPELPVKAGRNSRIYRNEVWDNNHPNFGLPGAIVSSIPAGSGLIIMATDNTEVFENAFRGNKTSNVSIISFATTGREYDDPDYDPTPEGIAVFNNHFEGGGNEPEGLLADTITQLIEGPMPDIVWDGVVDESKRVDGEIPAEYRIYVEGNNGTFVDLDLGAMMAGKKPNVVTDASKYAGSLPSPLAPIVLPMPVAATASGAY
jgi:parallel beta-helix repeat protein